MKNKSKILILFAILLLTGCTKQLKDTNGQVVKHPITGQNLVENIICRPEDPESIKMYEEAGVDLNEYPTCNEFSPFKTKYEGIWTNIFVKPLAWLILKVGYIVKDYGISLIIITILIRLLLYPLTNSTAMQSENLTKAKPELDKLEKKYAGKNDQDSMMKKSQEMMLIYKKYDINPFSSCLFAFLQLPIFFAFLEAVYRVPAFFEKNFLVFNLGTTPLEGIKAGNYWYIILVVLIILATVFSFKNMNMSTNKEQAKQMKMMTTFMIVFISFVSFGLPTSIALYWIVSNGFTVVQNLLLKKGK